MKNPMTTTEMKQAVDDNAAGYDMQYRSLIHGIEWEDRGKGTMDTPLNFFNNEYRRKPELMERFVNVYKNGEQSMWEKYHFAKKHRGEGLIRCIRLVEDTTWTEPVEEDKNPWRPIVKGEWPECKPGDRITLKWDASADVKADTVDWDDTTAIGWRYAEE